MLGSKISNSIYQKDNTINISFDEFWDLYDKKVSRDNSEKKWNKDEYLKEENSKKLYQNLIEANKKLELEFGLNSKEFKGRQAEIALSMEKIKEYKIFLKVTEKFNELQKVPLN